MGIIPDPRHIRLLKNDKAHAHRYANREEPIESPGRPHAPEYLSDRAREIFNDFVQRIDEMYPASETDLDIIVLYANNKEQLESYEMFLRKNGSTFEVLSPPDKKGVMHAMSVRARPEVTMLKECKALQLRILTEFGLSPSSRSRVNLKKPADKAENKFGAMPGASKTG